MSDNAILLAIEHGVAQLTINRPDKLNALDQPMIEQLLQCCDEIERADNTRVTILSGAGDRAFCAGGDISAWSELDAEAFSRFWIRRGHQAFDALARLRQPLIAVLDGHTLGGGLELAAVADYRIAEAGIRLGQPESGLGIVAGWSGTQRAVRRFGSQVVRRMALFGETFTADDALKLGLVDRVVAKGEAQAEARMVAQQVAERSPRATELTKMLINAAEGEEQERVLDALAGAAAVASPDLQIGLAAFRRREKPGF